VLNEWAEHTATFKARRWDELKAKPGAASVQSFWKERLGFAVGTPWG